MGNFLDSLSESTDYSDFRYVMQDSGNYYIGSKFTYGECMTDERIPFKFRAVTEHYILKDTDPGTSIESQLYYMTEDQFTYRTLRQLKARVKVACLTEKKKLFSRKTEQVYEEKVMSVEELAGTNLAVKKGSGFIIRELILSKLALMGFSV